MGLLVLSIVFFGFSMIMVQASMDYIRFALHFLFYTVITVGIIKQIWGSGRVNKNVIMGLMCGYICLGLVGFFVFMTIELVSPGSFQGLDVEGYTIKEKSDSILYYSYITLMTIGYGEIHPVNQIGQKAAILIGLMGQFYTVIVTAVVVGKFLNNTTAK